MTANDSDVSDGDTLTGSQVVRVYGENLTAPFVTMSFGGVEYTPLIQGEDYIGFILTNNGTAIIAVDGNQFMSFEVNGVVVPSGLTGYVSALLRDSSGNTKPGSGMSTDSGCLQYNQMVDNTYVQFRVFLSYVEGTSIGLSNLISVNATLTSINNQPDLGRVGVTATPIDPTKVCYITYDGFIFFVGNYTTE